ncbi:MAG: hypothetical protein L3J34_04540 [Flavobacteriaceae bacterium]|nr:hypothetical protein [Flavobacteriaceae bacterium]
MKKIKLLSMSMLAILLFMTACDTEDETDGRYYIEGEYTGVLIGSTGSYTLNLEEGKVTAKVLFDNIIYNLSINESLYEGESITLTDGKITILLVDDGVDINISFNIPNHHIESTIVLSESSEPNRDYIGWTENFRNGVKVYRTTVNLTLHQGKRWTGIERVDVDVNPDDPNHESDQGKITKVNGTFSEDNSSISFFFTDGSPIFTLIKVENKLTVFENGTTTFEVELTRVDL